MPNLFLLLAIEAALPGIPPAELPHFTQPCAKGEADEISVCAKAKAESPYRYPKLPESYVAPVLDMKLGPAHLGGGGPKGSVGVGLSIPF